MAEYVVNGAEPNETVLHSRTTNGYEAWHWLPVRERIVRCRDCLFYIPDPDPIDPCWPMMCERIEMDMVSPNGFCAWGERGEVDA